MDLADGLQLSSKQEKQLESAVTILSGIAAWEFQSTNKFDSGVSMISKKRFGDAIAQTFGAPVAQKLFPNEQISGKQTFSPANIINSTTLTGIGLLIIDKIADEFLGSDYRSLDGLQPLVRGLGKGVTIGGGLGGLFDDTYGRSIPSPGRQSGYNYAPSFDGGQRVGLLNR